VRQAYLFIGIAVAIMVMFNAPRVPWIEHEVGGPIGLFRGLAHGPIGFSYVATWALIVGGIYQLWLGLLYWDMGTGEAVRGQFTLDSAGTAKLLFITGALCLLFGILYAVFVYRNDMYLIPCGLASTAGAWLVCWLFWLAFPLYEQVGIDREELGV
jgi:hypothetical protein